MNNRIAVAFITFFLAIYEVDLGKITIRTRPDAVDYNFFPLATNYLEFMVKAKNDIIVALSNSHGLESTFYLITIGGWSNTKSVIRKDNYNIRVDYNATIISPGEFQKFWVRIDESEEEISVGKGNAQFLKFKDPNFNTMSYFGLATGHGSAGVWIFDSSMICNAPIV